MSYVARHAGRVKKGQLVLSDPAAWRAAVAKHEGRDVWVTVKRQFLSRTPQANRFYWGVVVDHIANCIGESAEDTHELLKAQFLPKRSIELLGGQGLEMPPSTRALSVEEFASYIERVRVWASQFLGLSIPDANEVEVSL
jgi:hypothetical protein